MMQKNQIMRKLKKNKGMIILTIIAYALAFIWLVPLLWAISISLKTDAEISNNILGLIPSEFTFHRYTTLLVDNPEAYPIFTWLGNSFFVAIVYTLLYLAIISLAGYAFSILQWKGRNQLFGFILVTMMVPGVVNLVPMFNMMVTFDWLGRFEALIFPGLGSVFGLFIVRQFLLGIPSELMESAKIDGANHFMIFSKIVLPLSTSALMVAGLFAFLGNWNDYLWPLVVMSGSGNQMLTLPAGLSIMQGSYGYDYGLTMTAAVISAIPVLIVFGLTQEKIVEGIARTGIK